MNLGLFMVMAGQKAGGPETYEYNLIKELINLKTDYQYHLFSLNREAANLFDLDQENVHPHVLWPKQRVISMSLSLPISLIKNRIDLYHATFTPPPLSPVDYVFTMHCFSNYAHPEFYEPRIRFRLNRLIAKGILKSRKIICVSENVRDHTAEMFKLPEEKFAVVYHGVSPRFKPMNKDMVRLKLAEQYAITQPYVLFSGKIESRKNVVRLIEAFHQCRQELKQDIKLVIAGRRTWETKLIDGVIQKHKLQEHVIEIGHIPNDDMPLLFNGATVFAFPSIWEGFGLPVIESMACGTPVITSNNSCLPEVTGGAALLVDPYSVDDISDAIYKMFTDEQSRVDWSEKGLKRASEFTWQRAARETMAVYQSLA